MGNTIRRKRGQKVGRKKSRRYRRFWARFFSHCEKSVLANARRLAGGDESRARDIMQEVFLHIWRSVPNPTLIANHSGYLLQVTRHVASQLRPGFGELQLDEVIESEPGNPRLKTEPYILEILQQAQHLKRACALRKDHAKGRTRLQLYLEGYTIAEIADRLKEKPARTRYELSKLRRKQR